MKKWLRGFLLIAGLGLVLCTAIVFFAGYQHARLVREKFAIRNFRVTDLKNGQTVVVDERNSRDFVWRRFVIAAREPPTIRFQEGLGEPVEMQLTPRDLADFDQELTEHRKDEADQKCPRRTKLELHWTLANASVISEETNWSCASEVVDKLYARGQTIATAQAVARRKAREQQEASDAAQSGTSSQSP